MHSILSSASSGEPKNWSERVSDPSAQIQAANNHFPRCSQLFLWRDLSTMLSRSILSEQILQQNFKDS